MGTKKGLESRVIPEANYNFETVEVSGFERRLSLNFFKSCFRLIGAIFRCRAIVNDFNPDIVVGLGGYVSAPVVAVAAFKRIPVLLHEQNAIPGLANKLLARRADVVAISFPSSERFFSRARRIVLTGNPVRTSVLGVHGKEYARFKLDSNRKTILIFGGSRGAKRINEAAIAAYPLYRGLNNLQIIHSTGKMNFDSVVGELKKLQSPDDKIIYCCYPYLDEINLAYADADLVVCRAGATTLAEITTLGKAAVLIPYPYATDDHQKKNAQVLEDAGAARLIEDRELSGKELFRVATGIVFDQSLLQEMSEASKGLGHSDAAQKMKQLALELVRSEK